MNKLWLANYNIFGTAAKRIENIQLPLKERVASVWNHEEKYAVEQDTSDQGTRTVRYDFLGDDAYMLDHRINGASLFPAAGHLYTAWGAIGFNKQVKFTKYKIFQS